MDRRINLHMKMLKTSNNQLPFLTRICIGSLGERPENMIIDEPKDANESAKQEKPLVNRVSIPEKEVKNPKKY